MKQTINADLDDNAQMPQPQLTEMKKAMESFAGKRVTITIAKYKKQRTNKQNAYFHGVVVTHVRMGLISAGTIITAEQTKDMLKSIFAKETKHVMGDDYIEIIKNTTDMSTTEFIRFMDRVKQWGAEFLGIIIPDPEHEFDDEQNTKS